MVGEVNSDKKMTWIPNKGVGDILIGNKIEDYIDSYYLVQSDKDYDNEYDRRTFLAPDFGVSITTESGVIVSMDIEDEFYYKDQNIIGMEVTEAIRILGCEPEEKSGPYVFDDGYVVTTYDYLSLGLLLWVNNNNVVSISCSDSYV